MKLIANAAQWHRLWSVRFAILSALLGIADVVLALWQGIMPPFLFATLSTISAVASAIARVVQQPALHADEAVGK